jgi:hypothetical protein
MEGSNNKYFSEVTTKLIDAKRRENIVIDNSFKAGLRQDVLNRSVAQHVQTDKPGFGDFFRKWRYVLAVVPSALIVMIVAAQFMDMPVDIESEQVVATGTDSVTEEPLKSDDLQNNVSSGDKTVQELPTNPPDEQKENEEPKESSLKTFPGSLVLQNNEASDTEESFESISSDGVSSYESYQPVQDSYNTPKSNTPSYNNFPVSRNNTNLPNQNNNPDRENEVISLDTYAVDSTTHQEEETLETPAVVSQPQKNIETVPDLTQEEGVVQNLPVNNYSLEVPLLEEVESLPQTGDSDPLDMEANLQKYQELGGNVNEFEVTPLLSVNYVNVFLGEEKRESLENDVIPFIVYKEEVDLVEVSECTEGDVLLKVKFTNGLETEKCLKYNPQTQIWDEVKKVERYYYDGEIKYMTRFKYRLR